MAQFERALKKLVDDPHYRQAVMKDSSKLLKDYQLGAPEMLALMHAWLATGSPDAAMSILDLCHCCCSTNK